MIQSRKLRKSHLSYETRDVELASVEEYEDSIAGIEENSLATLAVYNGDISVELEAL